MPTTRTWLWLTLILMLATALRALGPFLPQSTGDSLHYIALAMKLQAQGMEGYNLRGINLQKTSLNGSSTTHLLTLSCAPGNSQGDLLHELCSKHLDYYDEPLHHIAYGYPALISIMPAQGWQLVDCQYEPLDLLRLFPLILAAVQWTWLLPSVISSVLMILLTWYMGRRWFGSEAGLWAAFLIAIHPVDILTAQRIWADDALALSCLAALACGERAMANRSTLWAFGTGVLLGAGVLVKQSALFFALAIGATEALRLWLNPHLHSELRSRIRLGVIFSLGVLAVTAHWFFIIWKGYGTPFYNPPSGPFLSQNPWQAVLAYRPHPTVLFTIGIACLNPLLFSGFIRIKEDRVRWLILASLLFTFIFIGYNGREYRYLLPIFPLMAMAAGSVLSRITARWKPILVLLATSQLAWTIHLTLKYTWRNWGEIMTPF